jgi:hypothetical protein
MPYVVFVVTHSPSVSKEEAKRFVLLEDAVAYADWAGGSAADGGYRQPTDVYLFELGKQVPLETVKIEEPQLPKVRTRIQLRDMTPSARLITREQS